MRPKPHARRPARTWRPAREAGRSVLTKGRRSASRRANRFSQLTPMRQEPELTPLASIPTLAPWLAARGMPEHAHAV